MMKKPFGGVPPPGLDRVKKTVCSRGREKDSCNKHTESSFVEGQKQWCNFKAARSNQFPQMVPHMESFGMFGGPQKSHDRLNKGV